MPGGVYEEAGRRLGAMLDIKQRNYGDSFHRCAAFLRLLYPKGVPVSQYDNVLWMARIWDKFCRLSNGAPDAEDPIQDVAGYALLRASKPEERA